MGCCRLAVLLGAAAVSLAVAAPALAATAKPATPTTRLAWTAEILYPVEALKAPKTGAAVAMKLSGQTTFTRGPQVLLVLGSARDARGRLWVQVNLPKRPNGSKGWVPEEAVQLATTPFRVRVSVSSRTVTMLRRGRAVATYRAAVGKPGTPTATGLFAVADPVLSNGQLGPYILVLTAYSDALKNFLGGDGVSAIHGWGDTSVLGKAVSAGCVRLSRGSVRRLAKVATAGTPVEIVA
jgi:lipoprotein-anchoring transpeptidase ErfK/SrfK